MRALLAYALQVAVSLTWTPSTTPNATTTVYRDNTAIAQALSTASYTDLTAAPGLHAYYLTATAPAGTSGQSNTIQVTVPASPTATLIGTSTRVVNGNLTSVAITVMDSAGKPVTEGTVTWTVAGKVFFQDTLNKKGQDVQNVWTVMLNNLPVTITYSGSANFAASSATVQ